MKHLIKYLSIFLLSFAFYKSFADIFIYSQNNNKVCCAGNSFSLLASYFLFSLRCILKTKFQANFELLSSLHQFFFLQLNIVLEFAKFLLLIYRNIVGYYILTLIHLARFTYCLQLSLWCLDFY